MKVTYLLVLILIIGCSRQLTRQDVEEQISDARAEVEEAQEEVASAVQKREQFYEDYKASKLSELEKRNQALDDKIKDLKKTAKDSNDAAQANIESAIDNFRSEQQEIGEKINSVEQIEAKDWSQAYEEINEAIKELNQQLDRLDLSLDETEVDD